ncbi:MAG: carbohydrate kinase family protein [DPANN group archaeon]|nr:carbohydrate kinase family protein [DPANN group archaeon]
MYDVITVGSATVDVFAHTDKSELISLSGALGKEDFLAYPSGSKIIINRLMFTIGGGGTNTATCLRRLGLSTGYVGVIGDDENGSQIQSFLRKEKIDFLGVVGKEMTGYSIILDSLAHDRTILTYKGCNDRGSFSRLKASRLKTSWFYFASMMGSSLDMLKDLAVHAAKNRSRICFNPSQYLVCLGKKKIQPLLDASHILVLNREEAQTLLDGEGFKTERPIEHLLRKLQETVPLVVITDGPGGAWATDGHHLYHAVAHRFKIVESTGAGDAFASTFLAGIIKKGDLEHALRLAVTNAESVLEHHGAKNKLLSWSVLLRRMKKRPVNIIRKKMPSLPLPSERHR